LTDTFVLPLLPVSELFQHRPNMGLAPASPIGMGGVVHGSSTQTRTGELTPEVVQLTSTSQPCAKQTDAET
jgi:hypothetical protein